MKQILIVLLKAWRLCISPLYGDVCRYYPSCSAYALRAVQYHGAVKGSWYAARRLLRCHPWAPGGYDPVRGTPEFDDEMRDQGTTAATIGTEATGSDTTRAAFVVAQLSSSDGAGPNRPRTPDQLPHRHRMQGRVATVAQGRGVK